MSLENICQFYEELSVDDLKRLEDIYTQDVFFKDPFNEFKSIGLLKEVFEDMFENLENPKFIIIDKLKQNTEVFLTWDFNFSLSGKKIKIHGSSHLKLCENGKIYYHRDYWDVGEELLLKIPIIKFFYKKMRNKLSIKN